MNWDTIQQLIRIALYAGGSAIFGDAFADSEMYQMFIGGAVAVGAFLWWLLWERGTVHKTVPSVILFFIAMFLATQMLVACDTKRDPVTDEFCKSTYSDEASCSADSKCEWKVRPDGSEICRSK